MATNYATVVSGSKIDVVCAWVGGANTTPLFFSEFSAAYFAKRNLNGGGFQSEGAAEGGCGGNSAAPERPAGAKRRRSVPFKVGSREVYNYSTKTNLFGIDCSARANARAPQGKIRFCFRRKIPEFAPIY